MSNFSNRQHDTFANAAKMSCREANRRVLRDAAFLLWEDAERSRLRCDWCELMGESGWLTLQLLESENVLAQGGFVGIDLDAERIKRFRQQRPDLKWRSGNLYELVDAPELANVGILNLDEYGEVGGADAMIDFQLIRSLVQRGLEMFGEFALFWNQDLDAVVRHGRDRGQALRQHADMVATALQPVLPRRELTGDMLLSGGCEEQINAEAQQELRPPIRTLGAFDIYKGSKRGHCMANLRLMLR